MYSLSSAAIIIKKYNWRIAAHCESGPDMVICTGVKVFTSVGSGTKGEIARCLVEDAQFVEYGQALFLVRPDEG